MAMLAEKKKREKWSLNPRGKTWSEDQNKFGQRLMEKMGWKTGEGLGANSQGTTDIVKARVKNDSKGLGFKENGEEWLKTTSEFDSLLDGLAGSQGREDEGGQTDAPASLEERSKKSRARVHYHKFTRAKDLSRYSEKDLACIIGPDVIKLKSDEECTADYTQNQVNKGSLEEYFSKKLKSKNKNKVDNTNDNTCNAKEETVINLKTDTECLDINSAYSQTNSDLEALSLRKKKRKKNCVDNSEAEVHISNIESNIYEVKDKEPSIETKVSRKKKNKIKSGCDIEAKESYLSPTIILSSNQEVIDNNEIDGHKVSRDMTPRKTKRKLENDSQVIAIVTNVNNSEDLPENDENISNKKRRKLKDGMKEKTEIKNEQSLVDEQNESTKKKKKPKVTSKEQEVEQTELTAKCTDNSSLITENSKISSKKKKKKSKDKSEEQPVDFEIVKQQDVSTSTINPLDDGVTINNTEIVLKKKKKKSKEVNREYQEESLINEPTEEKKKIKQPKTDQTEEENRITALGDNQISSSNKTEDFIEVLGRKTRLKSVKNPCKIAPIDSYQTEEFMSFSKLNASETAPLKDPNKSSLMSKPQSVMQIKVEPNMKMTNLDEIPHLGEKVFDKKTKVMSTKVEKTAHTEDSNYVKCYGDPNSDECNLPKHVVAYEYRLVSARLKNLEISPPNVKVIIKDSKTLNVTTLRKLKQIEKIKHLKTLLPPKDKTEIETLVSKFYNNLKPKIEMMTIIAELEDKISEIGKNLEGKSDSKANENQTAIKDRLSEKNHSLTSIFKQLEILVDNFKISKNESNTSKDKSYEEIADGDDAGDGNESRSLWLKKVENKLETLKQHMKMLCEGKKPPCLNLDGETQNKAKKGKKLYKKVNDKKYNYQDTSYSRGRIAHNVRNQRGTGKRIAKGHTVAQNAVPYGGSGILKSYGTEEQEPPSENQDFNEDFGGGRHTQGRSFGDGRFTWRAKGLNSRGVIGQGRGDFMGRGSFGFVGRGRGHFGGRGRADMRGRGRISQNNFEAKLYAEKCKELNKVPNVCFNGVNLKLISGYPANVNTDKTSVPSNDVSDFGGNQPATPNVVLKQEVVTPLQSTKTVPGDFSKVVVKKEPATPNVVLKQEVVTPLKSTKTVPGDFSKVVVKKE